MRTTCQWGRLPLFCSRELAWACRAVPARSVATAAEGGSISFLAPREAHTAQLASLLAQQSCAGDVYCLHGLVGAGKSTFSRAFIRASARDASLPVPSPTYLLQHVYDEHEGPAVHHFDLYRLESAAGMARLDLASSFGSAVSLIEWAERLPSELLPQQRLEVHIHALADAQGALGLLVPLLDADSCCAGELEPADSEADAFADERWRRVELRAVGAAWARRLQQLAGAVAVAG